MQNRIVCFLVCLFFSSILPAGGGITHMFIAQEAIKHLPNNELQHLLLTNTDAYLVGAYYPDSGYLGEANYGEISHWDPFIYAFADYLTANYQDPATQNPKLTAFLMGCASHRISDEIIHHQFYHEVTEKDFGGDSDKTSLYADLDIDLLLVVEKTAYLTKPKNWWVPIKDLLAVYNRLRVKVTYEEIANSNKLISMAGDSERLLAWPAYPTIRWQLPWTSANYFTYPESGILADAEKVAIYQMKIWRRLHKQAGNPPFN